MVHNNCVLLIVHSDSRYFQLRAHIYQARGIIAANDNGLSDPFAKVVFSTQCQVTQVSSVRLLKLNGLGYHVVLREHI